MKSSNTTQSHECKFNKPHEPVRHIVLFSGGFDSAYVLYNLLMTKEDAIKNSKPNEIGYAVDPTICQDPMYANDEIAVFTVINSTCGPDAQRIKEKTARENLLSHMEEKFPDIDIEKISITTYIDERHSNKEIHHVSYGGLYQPIVWSFSLMPLLHENDKLYFSYIHGDQGPMFVNEIKRMISDCGTIMGLKNPISVYFPIKFLSKATILHDFYKIAGKKIFEDAVSCEGFNPDIKFCGNCPSCKKIKTALLSLVVNGHAEGAEFAIEYLEKYFSKDFSIMCSRVESYIARYPGKEGIKVDEKERNKEDTSKSSEIDTEERCDDTIS